MKMKIPIVDPTNIYNNHESSNDFMASENNDSSQPEEADSPTADDDFSEYLWMENEEEFDKQVIVICSYIEGMIFCNLFLMIKNTKWSEMVLPILTTIIIMCQPGVNKIANGCFAQATFKMVDLSRVKKMDFYKQPEM